MAFKKYFNARRMISLMIDEQKLKLLDIKAQEVGLNITEYIDLLINQELKIRNAFDIAKEKSRIILNVQVKEWFNKSLLVKDELKYTHNETKMEIIKAKCKKLLDDYNKASLLECVKPDNDAFLQIQALVLNFIKDKKEIVAVENKTYKPRNIE